MSSTEGLQKRWALSGDRYKVAGKQRFTLVEFELLEWLLSVHFSSSLYSIFIKKWVIWCLFFKQVFKNYLSYLMFIFPPLILYF